jgi:hypothetical protein
MRCFVANEEVFYTIEEWKFGKETLAIVFIERFIDTEILRTRWIGMAECKHDIPPVWTNTIVDYITYRTFFSCMISVHHTIRTMGALRSIQPKKNEG